MPGHRGRANAAAAIASCTSIWPARTLELDSPDIQLDVGGIAKGYAADQALATLSKLGIRSALIAVSGDLAFSDAPPGESGWKIGIDALSGPLLLSRAAVSTAGSSTNSISMPEASAIRTSSIRERAWL